MPLIFAIFPLTESMWSDQLRRSSMITPSIFVDDFCSRVLLSKVILIEKLSLVLPLKIMKCVFLTLAFRLFAFSHLDTLINSLIAVSLNSFRLSLPSHAHASSANAVWFSKSEQSTKSLKIIKIIMGPLWNLEVHLF